MLRKHCDRDMLISEASGRRVLGTPSTSQFPDGEPARVHNQGVFASMSEWTDDDIYNDAEAEQDRQHSKNVRHAIIGSIAGVALLIGPIVLANAIVSGDDPDVETSERAEPVAALKRQAETTSTTVATTVPETVPVTEPPVTEPPTTVPPTTPPTTTAPVVEAPAEEAEAPASSGGGFGDPYDYATWDALAECESGGNWSINTGNGYYGGLQFSLSTWRSHGGEGLPSDNSREEQIRIGILTYESGGWGQWPACTRKLGLR
jgi:hypothetical protein